MLISFADRISRGCDRRPVDLSLVGSRRFALNVFPVVFNDPQLSPSLTATYFALPFYTDKSFGFARDSSTFHASSFRTISWQDEGLTRPTHRRETSAAPVIFNEATYYF